jgi:hypothetical protein
MACTKGPSAPATPQEAYRRYLNLDPPTEISSLKYKGTEIALAITGSAFFTYEAKPTYFLLLEGHERFFEDSEFNKSLHLVSCQQANFPEDFSYWTDRDIKIVENKHTCFTGIFFPYVHYIIYDSDSEQVLHFVTGMTG